MLALVALVIWGARAGSRRVTDALLRALTDVELDEVRNPNPASYDMAEKLLYLITNKRSEYG